MPNSEKSIVDFKEVTKKYQAGAFTALDALSFSVLEGEFFCIIGPSGCGKSTILKIIAGLEEADTGRVIKPSEVAMVFQNGALLPWLNVFDNVAFGLMANNTPDKKIREETEKYLEMTGLKDLALKFPRELSGGQRQRVGLARALAVNPKVLLLDEPFSALDIATTEELHKDLIKIWQSTKKTVIMVSHLIEEAVSLADRIMLMRQGSAVETFRVNFQYPRREQASDFITLVQKIRKSFL